MPSTSFLTLQKLPVYCGSKEFGLQIGLKRDLWVWLAVVDEVDNVRDRTEETLLRLYE